MLNCLTLAPPSGKIKTDIKHQVAYCNTKDWMEVQKNKNLDMERFKIQELRGIHHSFTLYKSHMIEILKYCV